MIKSLKESFLNFLKTGLPAIVGWELGKYFFK